MVFGALRDGDSLSMKPYLMAEMVDYFLGITTITDIKEAFGQFAQTKSVAYPNPAVSFSRIGFDINEAANVSLSVFDEMGRLVRVFEKNNAAAGRQEIIWDLNNARGVKVNDGIYFYQLIVNDHHESSGKILIRR